LAKKICDYHQTSAKLESVGSAIPILISRIDSDTDPDADPDKRALIQREVGAAASMSNAKTEKGGAAIGVGVGIGVGIEKKLRIGGNQKKILSMQKLKMTGTRCLVLYPFKITAADVSFFYLLQNRHHRWYA
jgi:hypothetical protein